MFNVKFSKLGRAVANNPVLMRYIMDKVYKLTHKEQRRGYFEIQIREGLVLRIVVGPDRRTEEEKLEDTDTISAVFVRDTKKTDDLTPNLTK